MTQRLTALLLALLLALGLTACGSGGEEKETKETPENPEAVTAGIPPEELQVGILFLGNLEDAYSQNHLEGLRQACQELGMDFDRQVTIREEVLGNQNCVRAATVLAKSGCDIIFTTSLEHEIFMLAAAEQFPKVQFCQAGGAISADYSRENTHSYSAKIHQARYLSGIAAGMATETDQLGFVAAKECAEVISGFTAFYLGARSVNPDVTLLVRYTNAWEDPDREGLETQGLIDLGCDVISHYTDTTIPLEKAEANGVWGISYNQDTREAFPNATLTSVRVNWGTYYLHALTCLAEGRPVPQAWCQGFSEGACTMTAIHPRAGTSVQNGVDMATGFLLNGTTKVFTGPLYGVNGEGEVLSLREGESYQENPDRGAATFDYLVDGITVLP